jgi:IS30 family transposase
MGRKYEQLSLEERCEIARLQANGRSIRQIAAALDRAPSTIAREVRRNHGRQVGYKPSYAQEQMQARRWSGSRLEREPELREPSCNISPRAGRPSRSPAGSPAKPAAR